MTMSKARSPDKTTPRKRPLEPSPTRATVNGKEPTKRQKKTVEERFTFDDVKCLLDALLAQDKKKLEFSINSGLKQVDFNQAVVPGHTVERCQDMIDKLVERTRRVRTTEEVLSEIRANLKKRQYTDIIQRYGLSKDPPKRPASAYFLFHKERFPQLRDQLLEDYEEWIRANPGDRTRKPPQASDVAIKVSEEWRDMEPEERVRYQQMQNEAMKKYEKDMKKLGLMHIKKPKRPKSAKAMYIQSKLDELDKAPSKSKLAKLKLKLAEDFDKAEPDVKAYWTALSKEEHQQFQLETLKFCENNPHLDRNEIIKVRKKKVKVVPPSPPRNPWRIYLEKKLPENLEGQELKDTEARLKEKFNKLSVKKTLRLIKKAIKEKEEYDAEVAKFADEHPEIPLPNPKPNVTREQWKLYESHVENKPVAPAATAYLHYCSKTMLSGDIDDQKPTQRLQAASAGWLALSPSEKAEAYKEHKESIKQFIQDMEEWISQQSEARVERMFREDPKSKPEYWKKRLGKLEKAIAKKDFVDSD